MVAILDRCDRPYCVWRDSPSRGGQVDHVLPVDTFGENDSGTVTSTGENFELLKVNVERMVSGATCPDWS